MDRWDASQFKLVVAFMDEHGLQTSNRDHNASPEPTLDDWPERLLLRTRPHWDEVNMDAPDDVGENNKVSSQDRTQRNWREPVYLRDIEPVNRQAIMNHVERNVIMHLIVIIMRK